METHRRDRRSLFWWFVVIGGAAGALIAIVTVAIFFFTGDTFSLFRRDLTWAEMQRSKDFRVGLDPSFPPFEQLGESGLPEGYDVELAHALAEEWGIVAKIVPIGFDSLIDAVMAARVDAVISAMPFDERLTRDVAYSVPYFDAGVRLVVETGSAITGTGALDGRRVAVEWGSTGDMIARRLQRGDGDAEPIALEVVQFDTPDAVLGALLADASIDAALVDNVTLRLAQGRGMALEGVGAPLESSPYVIVSPRRATTLSAEINAALERFSQDGTLQQIENQWFGDQKGSTP